jgi:hypothetical protein
MNRGWRCERMYPARCADRASGAIPGPDFFVRTVPWLHGERLRDTFHRTMRSIERRQLRGITMAAIMSLDEPRPRGTLLGQRADRRHVGEAYHFFRCKACNGWIDAPDLVWVEDHEGELPHPAQDGIQ